jgi:hypothetical protein
VASLLSDLCQQLCKKTVLFSRKSTLKQFTSSLLSTFEGEFGPLISELDQWGKLIEQRTNLLATQLTNKAEENAVIRSRYLVQHVSGTSKRNRRTEQRQRLLFLSPPIKGHTKLDSVANGGKAHALGFFNPQSTVHGSAAPYQRHCGLVEALELGKLLPWPILPPIFACRASASTSSVWKERRYL